jgi:hypothetical protein
MPTPPVNAGPKLSMACILGREMRRESSSKARHWTAPDSRTVKGRHAGPLFRFGLALIVLWLLGCLLPGSALAGGLADDLGRNEVRVYASRFWVEPGRTITQLELPRRLERLGYERRRRTPDSSSTRASTPRRWLAPHYATSRQEGSFKEAAQSPSSSSNFAI